MKLLLVEDDKQLTRTLFRVLKEDYDLDIAHRALEAELLAEENAYDAAVLDLMLPDANGIMLCRRLRKMPFDGPIMMLTGNDRTETIVAALDCGADDYMTKPFKMDELKARIRALLRRKNGVRPEVLLTAGDLTFNPKTLEVVRQGQRIELRKKELRLLEFMMMNPGKVLTREKIMDHVWESQTESAVNTVDVHVKWLRA